MQSLATLSIDRPSHHPLGVPNSASADGDAIRAERLVRHFGIRAVDDVDLRNRRGQIKRG